MSKKKVVVRFDHKSHPGVRAIGPYKPGVPYEVDPKEAERLTEAKGFVIVEEKGK